VGNVVWPLAQGAGTAIPAAARRPLNTKERGLWSHVPREAWFQDK
jgi:hypothetical protein